MAISNETVSMAERITDAVTLSVPGSEVMGGPLRLDMRSVSNDRTLAATWGDLRRPGPKLPASFWSTLAVVAIAPPADTAAHTSRGGWLQSH